MIQCSRCRAGLPASSLSCPNCGEKFAVPVPAEFSFPAQISAAKPAAAKRGIAVLLWVLGGISLAALMIGGLAFFGYRSLQGRLGGRLSVQEAAPGRQGSWTASQTSAALLAPPFQVAGPLGYYTVQPPAGYTLHGTKMDAADGKSVIYTWTGPMTDDRTAPQFVLSFGSDGGVMTSRLSSAQDVAIGLRSVQRDHAQVAAAPIQSGSINGLAFSRGYWKGVGARTGRRFHGLVYCQIASPNMINMYAEDSEPSSRTTLPTLDAAALSLRLVKRME